MPRVERPCGSEPWRRELASVPLGSGARDCARRVQGASGTHSVRNPKRVRSDVVWKDACCSDGAGSRTSDRRDLWRQFRRVFYRRMAREPCSSLPLDHSRHRRPTQSKCRDEAQTERPRICSLVARGTGTAQPGSRTDDRVFLRRRRRAGSGELVSITGEQSRPRRAGGFAGGSFVSVLWRLFVPWSLYRFNPRPTRVPQLVRPLGDDLPEHWYAFFDLLLRHVRWAVMPPGPFSADQLAGYAGQALAIFAKDDCFFPGEKAALPPEKRWGRMSSRA